MKWRMMTVLAMGLLFCSCNNKKSEIEGVWTVVSADKDPTLNKGPKKEQWAKAQFTFTTDKFHIDIDGSRQMEGTLTLRPAGNPKELDLLGGKPPPMLGVYKLEGDELTICFSPSPPGQRPVEFAVKPGSMRMLLVLKRQRP